MEWPRRLAIPIRAVRTSTRVEAILAPAAAGARRPDATTDRARVASVHATSFNVRVGCSLVTVARASVGGLPIGIAVGEDFDPRAAGVREGDGVAIDGSLLRAGGLAIDLSSAERWSPHLPHRPIPADLAERAAVLRSAVEPRGAGRAPHRAADRRRPTGPASPWRLVDDVFEARLRILRAAVRRGHDAAIAAAGRSLVGLGVGLTPSGDDVLVGLSAAWTAIGEPAASDLAADWRSWAAGRTTDVALAFHAAAADGDYAERLHDALSAVLDGPIAAISGAAARAAAWGATSGRDTLRGVLIGLEGAAAAAQPNTRAA